MTEAVSGWPAPFPWIPIGDALCSVEVVEVGEHLTTGHGELVAAGLVLCPRNFMFSDGVPEGIALGPLRPPLVGLYLEHLPWRDKGWQSTALSVSSRP